MVLLYILFLFGLLELEIKSLKIERVIPSVIQIIKDKTESISLALVFDEDLNDSDRKNAMVRISCNEYTKDYKALSEQDKTDSKKIEFSFSHQDFVNYDAKYEVIYNPFQDNIKFDDTILIYQNPIELKNPINRYELTGSNNIRTIKYELQYSIFKDEISKIIYYDTSNSDTKYILSSNDYQLQEKTKLIIKFPGQSRLITFGFEILYPEYDKSKAIPDKFYLYFHNFLLQNEAIYLDKGSIVNKISFKTLLKQSFNNSPFIITNYNGQNMNCESFSCEGSDSNYLCDCTLNFGMRSSPGKITIIYENNQYRDLYYILYQNYMERCYIKGDEGELQISMEWIEEMEYYHYLYFKDTIPKPLASTRQGKTNSIITYLYNTPISYLTSGRYTLESSIPSLNYTDYNSVDEENLYVYIYPKTKLSQLVTSYVFTHNSSSQIISLSFEDQAADVLNELILRNDNNNEIKVSRAEKQCEVNGNSYSCDLKDIIYNYDEDKEGAYKIYYNSECGDETEIEGRIIMVERGYQLLSISPSLINLANVEGTELSLVYDMDMTDKFLIICLYNDDSNIDICYTNSLYSYSPKSKINQNVIISLKNIPVGIYHVYTRIISNGKNIREDKLGFQVIDLNIEFNFSHHYFVLSNNGNADENKLIIKVNDKAGKFGCGIIENSKNQNITRINCSYFEYPIKELGTIKFSFYHKDNQIIPLEEYIVVVQYYNQLFSFNSLKYCYYYNDMDLSIDIGDSYKNKFKLFAYIKSTDNMNIYNLTNNENKFSFENNINLTTDKTYNLYISENKIFLYKVISNIIFTDIKIPEFIIDPNKTIVFSQVKCDLSNSKFSLKKSDNSIQKSLSNCQYNNEQITCAIQGQFYTNNLYYKNFYYTIDDKNIFDINDHSKIAYTFFSRKLNEASFIPSHQNLGNYYSVTIRNTEQDFYFPLISNITNILVNEKEEKTEIVYQRGNNRLLISDNSFYLMFVMEIEINSVLYIDHLTRDKKEWETNIVNSTLYHFFDYSINLKRFSVYPTIFAFHDITGKEYPIKIILNLLI